MLCNCTLNEAILLTFSTKNLHVKKRIQIFVKFLGQLWVKQIKFPMVSRKSYLYTDLKFSKHLLDDTSVLVYNEIVKNTS